MWTFDLQLFKGNSGSQQINDATQYYQQLAGESSALFQQFDTVFLPMIEKLVPELQGTVQGQSTALTRAAQEPVIANTQRMLASIQDNAGGVLNPNALYSDVALQGGQQAGLAGVSTLQTALQGLTQLAGLGYEGVNTGTNALGTAAGGSAQLGLNLQQQSNQWWQDLLGAAGTYFGAQAGGGGGAAAPSILSAPRNTGPLNTGVGFDSPSSIPYYSPSMFPGFNASAALVGAPSTDSATGTQSAPISTNSNMGPFP